MANCFIDPAATTWLMFDLQHCVIWKKRVTEHTAWKQAVLEYKECRSGSLKLGTSVLDCGEFLYVFFSLTFLFVWFGLVWVFLPCPLRYLFQEESVLTLYLLHIFRVQQYAGGFEDWVKHEPPEKK